MQRKSYVLELAVSPPYDRESLSSLCDKGKLSIGFIDNPPRLGQAIDIRISRRSHVHQESAVDGFTYRSPFMHKGKSEDSSRIYPSSASARLGRVEIPDENLGYV